MDPKPSQGEDISPKETDAEITAQVSLSISDTDTEKQQSSGQENVTDPYLVSQDTEEFITNGILTLLQVTWDGSKDPNNPYNWSETRKWLLTFLLSFGGLVTLMSGAMLSPALQAISHDLGSSKAQAQAIMSIYVLAFAVGPMVLAPFSEVFGRRVIWISCTAFYVVWSIAAGFSQSTGALIAFRILGGFAASAELVVSMPMLADCWRSEERGKSYMINNFLPLLGPATGPVIGGVVTEKLNWRWIFWVLAIYDGILLIGGIFILPETCAVVLLGRKAAKLRKETGLPYYAKGLEEPLGKRISRSLLRPSRLLLTHPFIQVMAVLMAYSFGLLYLSLSTFATLWITRYHQSELVSGLHYFSLATGYLIASQLGGRLMDWVWAYFKRQSGGTKTAPEYRVPMMIPGTILVPVGLFVYGWTAQNRLHWIVPDIGMVIFGCGFISSQQAMSSYVTEAYLEYVASAMAATQFLRNIAAFCFTLFAPSLFDSIGYGWGNSILAFANIILFLPAPIILWLYGARLRARGRLD